MLVDPPAWTVDTTGSTEGDSVESSTPVPTGSRENTPDLKNGADAETDAIRIGEDGMYYIL